MRYHTPVFTLGIWEYTKATYDICLNAKLSKCLYIKKLHINNSNLPETVIETSVKSLKITSLHHTFENCYWLKEIIIDEKIVFENITNIRCMFKNCINLEQLTISENTFPNVIESSYSLQNCNKLNIHFYEDGATEQSIIEIGQMIQRKEDLNLIIRMRKVLRNYSKNVKYDKTISISKYTINNTNVIYSEMIKIFVELSDYYNIVNFLSKSFDKLDLGIVSL